MLAAGCGLETHTVLPSAEPRPLLQSHVSAERENCRSEREARTVSMPAVFPESWDLLVLAPHEARDLEPVAEVPGAQGAQRAL